MSYLIWTSESKSPVIPLLRARIHIGVSYVRVALLHSTFFAPACVGEIHQRECLPGRDPGDLLDQDLALPLPSRALQQPVLRAAEQGARVAGDLPRGVHPNRCERVLGLSKLKLSDYIATQ